MYIAHKKGKLILQLGFFYEWIIHNQRHPPRPPAVALLHETHLELHCGFFQRSSFPKKRRCDSSSSISKIKRRRVDIYFGNRFCPMFHPHLPKEAGILRTQRYDIGPSALVTRQWQLQHRRFMQLWTSNFSVKVTSLQPTVASVTLLTIDTCSLRAAVLSCISFFPLSINWHPSLCGEHPVTIHLMTHFKFNTISRIAY